MAIRAKGNRYIIDYYPRGRAGRRVVYTLPVGTTEEQARTIEREVRAHKSQHQITAPSGNIARLMPHYLKHCEMYQSAGTTYDKRSHFNTYTLPFFGHMYISDLTNAHLSVYKQQMKTKEYRSKLISNCTINKGMNYFSAFLKWADEELHIAPALPLRFRRLPHTRPVPIVLTLGEVLAFITSAETPYNVLFKIFFYLGLRNRAARILRWQDIDWSKHAIKTTEKGNKVRWHPLPDDLFDEMRGLYISSKSEWMFPSPLDSRKPINNILKAVRRAKEKAGIEKRVYPHLLRHSIGTHLMDSDVDIRQIQSFLGHAQISTTEWYTQVSIEKKRQAMEKAGIKTSKM